MRLTSRNSSFFLSILGYQHPDAAGEPYDANWLSIHVEASGPGGAWTGTDPCLLTYEAVRLADWLAAVDRGRETTRAISFLEPVLLFRLVDPLPDHPHGSVLRVHFGNLINPTWRQFERGAGQGISASNDLFLDFPLTEVDLATAVRELREVLKRYPNRAEQ